MDNPIDRPLRALDGWQQRHRLTAVPVAVVKKFGDDQAGNFVALLTYYAFVSTFPLLLVLVTVTEIVLGRHPELRRQLMPKKFWKHMTEMTELPVPGSPASPAARPGADPSLPQPSCGLLHDGSSLAECPSSL